MPDFATLQALDTAFVTGNYSIPDIRRLAEAKGLYNRQTNKPYSYGFFIYYFKNQFYHDGFTWEGKYYLMANIENFGPKKHIVAFSLNCSVSVESLASLALIQQNYHLD